MNKVLRFAFYALFEAWIERDLSDFFLKRKLCIPRINQYGSGNSNSSIFTAIPSFFLCFSLILYLSSISMVDVPQLTQSRHSMACFKRKLSTKLFSISQPFESNEPATFIRGIHPDRVAKLLGRNLINGTRFVWCYSQCHPTYSLPCSRTFLCTLCPKYEPDLN